MPSISSRSLPFASRCPHGDSDRETSKEPNRTLNFLGDFPQADEPLPKFLDDPTMEKFKAALACDPDPRRHLMVEILAQTDHLAANVVCGMLLTYSNSVNAGKDAVNAGHPSRGLSAADSLVPSAGNTTVIASPPSI